MSKLVVHDSPLDVGGLKLMEPGEGAQPGVCPGFNECDGPGFFSDLYIHLSHPLVVIASGPPPFIFCRIDPNVAAPFGIIHTQKVFLGPAGDCVGQQQSTTACNWCFQGWLPGQGCDGFHQDHIGCDDGFWNFLLVETQIQPPGYVWFALYGKAATEPQTPFGEYNRVSEGSISGITLAAPPTAFVDLTPTP